MRCVPAFVASQGVEQGGHTTSFFSGSASLRSLGWDGSYSLQLALIVGALYFLYFCFYLFLSSLLLFIYLYIYFLNQAPISIRKDFFSVASSQQSVVMDVQLYAQYSPKHWRSSADRTDLQTRPSSQVRACNDLLSFKLAELIKVKTPPPCRYGGMFMQNYAMWIDRPRYRVE